MEVPKQCQERSPLSHPTALSADGGFDKDLCGVDNEAAKKRRDLFSDKGTRRKKKRRIGMKDPLWLVELHNKLWRREDLFHHVFRAVDLTKEDFIELQTILHHLNPSRNHKSYLVAGDVLETKMNFLQSRTTTHTLTITTDSPVPKVVLCASEGVISLNPMDVDESFDSNHDEEAKNDKGADGDLGDEDEQLSECEDDDGADKSYIDEDAAVLSHGSTPVLPCTVRYMDLTCLKLQHFKRVPDVLLIRDEWDAVIDIFNKRKPGTQGGALWTGQSGIGKTSLLYFILVVCLIKAQPIVFQDTEGAVFTIDDEVRRQTGKIVTVPGNDVLALVDGSDKFYEPARSIRTARNLRTLLKCSASARRDQRWLTQIVKDLHASYVIGPWHWNELAIASIFLSEYDITLRRLRKAVKFSGFIPQQLFEAVMSPDSLNAAESAVISATIHCSDIWTAIQGITGKLSVPHRAFMIYPGDEERRLVQCLVKPVSDWALGIVFNKLESQGGEAAYKLFQRIEGYPPTASFRRQLWEHQVQRYFCSGNLSSLTIRCLEDGESSTTEWRPFKTFVESFDAIIYQSDKPDSPTLMKENQTHLANTCRSMLLSKKLLGSSDAVLNFPIRPLGVRTKPWIVLFVVPAHMEHTFKKQKFKPDVAFWQEKTKQYVLGLYEYAVFHYDNKTIPGLAC